MVSLIPREATPEEVEAYWTQLTRIWQAYQVHYERSGKRAIFILEKAADEPPLAGARD